MSDPRDLLREIGEALYGPRWQTDMADALGVDPRTVRYWLSGRQQPQPGVWNDLRTIAEERCRRIKAVAKRLKNMDCTK
jgi:Fe-S-cluster formation regulator IscX/YfhJ